MIALRIYREEDRPAFVELVTDADVMHHMGGPIPERLAQARFDAFLSSAGARLPCVRAAKDGDAYVGHGFLVERADLAAVEVGFIVAPSRRGRGHGTAIAEALVRIGFEEMGLTQVIATVDEDHAASLRVLEKAGFDDLGLRSDAQGPYRLLGRRNKASSSTEPGQTPSQL